MCITATPYQSGNNPNVQQQGIGYDTAMQGNTTQENESSEEALF